MVVRHLDHKLPHDCFKMMELPVVRHQQEGEPDPEPDITNFSTASSHRLPTVSATQALRTAAATSRRIPTTLQNLDALFGASLCTTSSSGVPRGQVTEVYGPPGVGKTAFALQVAVNAAFTHDSTNRVCLVTAGPPLVPQRLLDFIAGYRVPPGQDPACLPPAPESGRDVLGRFSAHHPPTLAHLLVLFLHTPQFPPPRTAVVVIDDLSNLLLGAFPRHAPGTSVTRSTNNIRQRQQQPAASRRWAVLAELSASFSRMAASRNIAVIVTTQVGTTLIGQRAVLRPALSGRAWEIAVHNRILLYRDFVPPHMAGRWPEAVTRRMRFARVEKLNGTELEVGASGPATFVIRKIGLQQVNLNTPRAAERTTTPPTQADLPSPALLEAARPLQPIEIADSEDEDELNIFLPSSPPDHDDADMLLSADITASYILDNPPYLYPRRPDSDLNSEEFVLPPIPPGITLTLNMTTATELHEAQEREEAAVREREEQRRNGADVDEDGDEEERLTSSGNEHDAD